MFGPVELRPVNVVLLPRSRRRIQLDPSIVSVIRSSILQALIPGVFEGPPRHISEANSEQGLPPCNGSPSRLSSDLFRRPVRLRIRINAGMYDPSLTVNSLITNKQSQSPESPSESDYSCGPGSLILERILGFPEEE